MSLPALTGLFDEFCKLKDFDVRRSLPITYENHLEFTEINPSRIRK